MSLSASSPLSRRAFVGAVAAGGAGAMASLAAPASNARAVTREESSEANDADEMHSTLSIASVSPSATAEDYFIAPDPIDPSDIAATEDYDVVVVGAGMSGVTCALKAVQQGARVCVLQKSPTPITHGHAVAAPNVQAVLDAGVERTDIEALEARHIEQNMNNVNHALLDVYFNETVEAITWLVEQTTALGVGPDQFRNGSDPCLVWAPRPVLEPVIALADEAAAQGATFHYATPAVRLITDGAGGVTGVVARREDGTYLQTNASRGVVLACGDYGNEPELVRMWCPMASFYDNFYEPADNTGDGYLMAKWIGAQISPYSHTKMCHVHHYKGDGDVNAPMRTVPWLNVDGNGRRCMNEAVKYEWRANAVATSPNNYAIQIFDSSYNEDLAAMGQSEVDVDKLESFMDTLVDSVFKADTIEDLAEQLGLDPATLSAQVSRYNEMAEQGHDDDFGKDPAYLYPIDTPPYYAIRRRYVISAIMGGLQVNERSQVLDDANRPIKGLYAIGNMQGGLFGATDYSFAVNGMSLGRAATFGYVVGRDVMRG